MHTPLISIGLPVRNGEDFLEETLQSLLSQTLGDFELIISDNASDDRTPSICREFAARDARLLYHRFENNVGAARNYNYVFEQARAPFFKWAAHDDICLPGFLEKCLEEFARTPAAVVVYPRTELIDAQGVVAGVDRISLATGASQAHERLRNFYRQINLANPVFGVIRSDALRKTRLIDSFVKSDVVLLAELLMLGEFRELPEILFRRRLHEKRSLVANRTHRDLLTWFDPSKRVARRWVSISLRLSWEYTRSIFSLPLPVSDRTRCLAVTARWQWYRAFRRLLRSGTRKSWLDT